MGIFLANRVMSLVLDFHLFVEGCPPLAEPILGIGSGLIVLNPPGGCCCCYSRCTSEEMVAQVEDLVCMVRQIGLQWEPVVTVPQL